jgi:hypothetical protein
MLGLEGNAGLAGLSKLMLSFDVNAGLFAGATGRFDADPAAADLDGVLGSASRSNVELLFNDAAMIDAAEPGSACGFEYLTGLSLSSEPSID